MFGFDVADDGFVSSALRWMIMTETFTITPPDFLIHPGLRAVLAAVPAARLVGGCVRDALAGVEVHDIDLATPDAPQEVVRLLEQAGLRAIPTGIAHGTITAFVDGESIEITTLRRDVQTDGRHAVVAFTDDWRQDAARRDFTINAMSMTPDGTVFDYFGGADDLRAGVVRFVGEAALRIREDYLRILRYFRFFARYNPAMADPAATAAIAAERQGLAQLSAERVWSEMRRILEAASPDRALGLMQRLGVLAELLPEARLVSVDLLPADPVLRLAALLPQGRAPLNLSGAEAERLAALVLPALSEEASDDDLRRALADTAPEILIGRAWLAGSSPMLRVRIASMPVPVFPVQGRDLAQAGVQPGPEMGRMLRDLRAEWLRAGCLPDRAALLARVR
ncbi:MAG: CCA tRNA nucleotidyltransferase [Acetobacteraceae bacterium]|nr:CCA tRNA nucleotidyltransferase [Acetobacteraceae bacterium]